MAANAGGKRVRQVDEEVPRRCEFCEGFYSTPAALANHCKTCVRRFPAESITDLSIFSFHGGPVQTAHMDAGMFCSCRLSSFFF